MAKLTLSDPSVLDSSILPVITNNNTAIETALENTLSRDGTSPNQMDADFDMNGNQILNVPVPVASTDLVRLLELTTEVTRLEELIEDVLTDGAGGDVLIPLGGTTG